MEMLNLIFSEQTTPDFQAEFPPSSAQSLEFR